MTFLKTRYTVKKELTPRDFEHVSRSPRFMESAGSPSKARS